MRDHRLSVAALTGVIFFIVCGGPFGIEDAVNDMGIGWTAMLLVALPFLWSLPIALVVSELTAWKPEEGGYYAWVRAELGDFWGAQAGWWAMCASVFDMAIYPGYFVRYLEYFSRDLQQGGAWARWPLAAGFIAVALALNVRGARAVGRNSVITAILVMAPFVALGALVLWHHDPGRTVQAIADFRPEGVSVAAFAAGLAVVMWNYMGWDAASTFAAEVRDAPNSYIKALVAVCALSALVYLGVVVTGYTLLPDRARWTDSVWPALGHLAAGSWLASAIAISGVVAQWSLFNGNFLYSSRIPYAMARDGWLPAALARTTRSGTPFVALCTLAAIAALLAWFKPAKLLVVDVLAYCAVLLLELVVLFRLRLKRGGAPAGFRIPGGWPAVAFVTLAPALCASLLLWGTIAAPDEPADEGSLSAREQLAVVAGILLSGAAIYGVGRRRNAKIA